MKLLKNRKTLLAIICLFFAATYTYYYYKSKSYESSEFIKNMNSGNFLRSDSKIIFKDTTISVEVADTPEKQARGLSGKNKISDSEGMLFVSKYPTIPTFWMKDMNFSLDFIWINGDKIVDISENVPNPIQGTADSELPFYHPKTPVDKVLEVNSGFVQKHKIVIGDIVKID